MHALVLHEAAVFADEVIGPRPLVHEERADRDAADAAGLIDLLEQRSAACRAGTPKTEAGPERKVVMPTRSSEGFCCAPALPPAKSRLPEVAAAPSRAVLRLTAWVMTAFPFPCRCRIAGQHAGRAAGCEGGSG
jgi:hypothetical protein